MSSMKRVFSTTDGSTRTEMREIAPQSHIKDLVEQLLENLPEYYGNGNVHEIKVYRQTSDPAEKDTSLPDDMPVANLPDRKPVHMGKSRIISVRIHYMGGTQSMKVSPGMLTGALLDEALRHFKPEDYRDMNYIIRVCGSEQEPGKGLAIAALVKPGDNDAVELDLVPAERWQG